MSWEKKMIKRGRGRPKKIVQEQPTSKVSDWVEAFVNTEDFAEVFIHNLVGKAVYELRLYSNCRNPEVMKRIRELLTVMSEYADSLHKEEPLD